jgi:hypothetical protein
VTVPMPQSFFGQRGDCAVRMRGGQLRGVETHGNVFEVVRISIEFIDQQLHISVHHLLDLHKLCLNFGYDFFEPLYIRQAQGPGWRCVCAAGWGGLENKTVRTHSWGTQTRSHESWIPQKKEEMMIGYASRVQTLHRAKKGCHHDLPLQPHLETVLSPLGACSVFPNFNRFQVQEAEVFDRAVPVVRGGANR